MKAKAVDFIAYTVADMDRAEASYRDALALEASVPRGKKGTPGNGFMEFEVGRPGNDVQGGTRAAPSAGR